MYYMPYSSMLGKGNAFEMAFFAITHRKCHLIVAKKPHCLPVVYPLLPALQKF